MANEKTKPKGADGDDAAPVEVRVLLDCYLGKMNDVVTLPAETAAALQGDMVDAHPSAVATAKELQAQAAAEAKAE